MLAGMDEAGRGPLAGPVVAAVVVMDGQVAADLGAADSKKITAAQRERLLEKIAQSAVGWGVGLASACEIDTHNILQATFLAMRRAVQYCPCTMEHVWIDGRDAPEVGVNATAVIGGDASMPVISCASIVAKVFRDHLMQAYCKLYQGYGFSGHKGYGTLKHMQALQVLGPSPIHRHSFRPVREAAQKSGMQCVEYEVLAT